MKKLMFFFILVINHIVYTQEKPNTYAHMVIDTLCAPHFDGRGYFNNGEKRASEFIKNEYQKIGLESVNGNYLQEFNLTTNAIVGDLELKLNEKILQPGVDYLVKSSSPYYKNKSDILYLEKSVLVDIEKIKDAIPFFRNKFVVIDQTLVTGASKEIKSQVNELIQILKFHPDIALNGVVEVVEKTLTFGASQEKAKRPHIVVLKNKLPKKIKNISVKIENEFNPNYQSQNVIGVVEGEIKNKFIYITAHYDHLGRMGKDVYFPGANDNASGVAMLLSLAKEFVSNEKPKYSMVFIAFGAEEIGLVGSKYYTENPLLPLENIEFLINLDILGTGDDGIQVVNGEKHPKEFKDLVKLNEDKGLLKQVKIRGEACNSDHCFFSEKGVPSFFMYTLGGVAHYHNIYDKSETLPLTEFDDLFILLKDFIKKRGNLN